MEEIKEDEPLIRASVTPLSVHHVWLSAMPRRALVVRMDWLSLSM